MIRSAVKTIVVLLLVAVMTPLVGQSFPHIEIEIEQDSIDELESHPYTNEDVHGSFVADGVRTESAELHYRGAYNLWSLIRKGSLRNWKVKFEKTEMYENRREWNFNYETYIRQNLSYQVFREAGVPCVSAENVVLSVNGSRQGIYLKYEDPDNKTWLADVFGDDEGDLYKAAYDMPDEEKFFADLSWLGDQDEDYFLHYRKQTNKKGDKEFDYSSLISLIAFINHSSDSVFAAGIGQRFAVDAFIRYLVVSNYVANWDSYPFRPKNFFLYQNPADSLWYYIPWDLDGTFQEEGGRNPIGTTGSIFHYFDGIDPYDHTPTEPLDRPLVWRLMAIEKYRKLYVYEYQQAMGTYLDEDRLLGKADSILAAVTANANEEERQKYSSDRDKVRAFIEVRDENVNAELALHEPYVFVSGVLIEPGSLDLFVDSTYQLSATILPENADEQGLVWTSEDSAVVQVDESGNLMASAAGSTWVTVKSLEGDFSDNCIITVTENSTVMAEFPLAVGFEFFPNPSLAGLLHISAPGAEKLVIHNSMGLPVLNNTVSEETFDLDVSGLAPGIYYISALSGNELVTRKLVISR